MTPPSMLEEIRDASAWYSSHDAGDGITHIEEPFIDPFYRCNMWFVRGRNCNLLLDSGLGAVSLSAQLPWLQAEPILAVASHAHFDHIGCHHEFPLRASHRAEASIMAHPDRDSTLATRYARLDMFHALPPGGFDEATYAVRPAPVTRLLEEGDVIDLGDRHFEVLHVPGHSPGSIALWEASTGVLLAGDTVYDGPLVDDTYHSNPDDYVESMQRLRALPARVVHAGHFPSFGRERFVALIDDYVRGRRAPGCPTPPASAAPHP